MFTSLLDRLVELPAFWVLLAASIMPFVESLPLVDSLAPGEVGMSVLGASTTGRAELLVPVIVLASVACFAGDCVGYWLGSRYGRSFFTHTGRLGRSALPAVDSAERYFSERGSWLIFVGRWIGILRGILPFVVGMSKKPFHVFAAWAAPAAVLWCTTLVLLGYFVGEDVARFLDRAGFAVGVVGIMVVLVIWLVRRRGRVQDEGHDGDTKPTAGRMSEV